MICCIEVYRKYRWLARESGCFLEVNYTVKGVKNIRKIIAKLRQNPMCNHVETEGNIVDDYKGKAR